VARAGGGSAIEASKIAGHSDLEMTGKYTFVTPERQNEQTRRIQEKLAAAERKPNERGEPEPLSSGRTDSGRHGIADDTSPVVCISKRLARYLR
jgi:hypothetical protein